MPFTPGSHACRAGLFKQLAEVKNLVSEFREDPQRNEALRGPIVENLRAAGLHKDCPFRPTKEGDLTAEAAMDVPVAEFKEYTSRLYSYLQAMTASKKHASTLCFVVCLLEVALKVCKMLTQMTVSCCA